jgi:hypothetical protein
VHQNVFGIARYSLAAEAQITQKETSEKFSGIVSHPPYMETEFYFFGAFAQKLFDSNSQTGKLRDFPSQDFPFMGMSRYFGRSDPRTFNVVKVQSMASLLVVI